METYNILYMDISYYEPLKNHLYNVYGLLYMAYVVFYSIVDAQYNN